MENAIRSSIDGAVSSRVCHLFSAGEWRRTSVPVPDEMALTIFVNGQELATILCTPTKLNCLIVGFLYSEGIISDMGQVMSLRVCQEESLAEVRLNRVEFAVPGRRILTSGCGGGLSFAPQAPKVNSDLTVTPAEVLSLMKQLHARAELYQFCGGVHTSALASRQGISVVAEDIGRHNTLDKIQGECLLRGIPTQDSLLLSTGRLTSEMLLKAAKMAIPILVSRSSPTERAISLAQELGVTLIAYARGDRLSVYSHQERVLAAPENR
ncbi:MAG TPA: formate dehydrogenase accessory sulfurtransferase FdhD [Dehalococcoidia bacterium]|nr:formate dehydrogenase accessory sulfurtransferase FdhD [Dehalococcoidia bacterium]